MRVMWCFIWVLFKYFLFLGLVVDFLSKVDDFRVWFKIWTCVWGKERKGRKKERKKRRGVGNKERREIGEEREREMLIESKRELCVIGKDMAALRFGFFISVIII